MSKLVSGLSSLTGLERTVNTLQLCLSNVGTFRVASGFCAQRTDLAQSVLQSLLRVGGGVRGGVGGWGAQGRPNDAGDHASCPGGTVPLREPLKSSQPWTHYGYDRE